MALRFILALHLPFDDADTFNRVQKEDFLPDDMVFVKQPLEDLPQGQKLVPLIAVFKCARPDLQ